MICLSRFRTTHWCAIRNKNGRIKRITVFLHELGHHFDTIQAALKNTSKEKKLSQKDEDALFAITSKQGYPPALSYYRGKEQKKDRTTIKNEINPYQIFLKEEKENFQKIAIDEWIKILPVISELSNFTKQAAYQPVQAKLEKQSLSTLAIFNNEKTVSQFINSIPTEKLIFWLSSEEKVNTIIKNADTLCSILKRLPINQYQDRLFYAGLIKSLPKIVRKFKHCVNIANSLTIDRFNQFIAILSDAGVVKSIVTNGTDFCQILSYCAFNEMKNRIYTDCIDQLEAIMKEDFFLKQAFNIYNFFRVMPENRLMGFCRKFHTQITETLENSDMYDKEKILEAVPDNQLIEFCEKFKFQLKEAVQKNNIQDRISFLEKTSSRSESTLLPHSDSGGHSLGLFEPGKTTIVQPSTSIDLDSNINNMDKHLLNSIQNKLKKYINNRSSQFLNLFRNKKLTQFKLAIAESVMQILQDEKGIINHSLIESIPNTIKTLNGLVEELIDVEKKHYKINEIKPFFLDIIKTWSVLTKEQSNLNHLKELVDRLNYRSDKINQFKTDVSNKLKEFSLRKNKPNTLFGKKYRKGFSSELDRIANDISDLLQKRRSDINKNMNKRKKI